MPIEALLSTHSVIGTVACEVLHQYSTAPCALHKSTRIYSTLAGWPLCQYIILPLYKDLVTANIVD